MFEKLKASRDTSSGSSSLAAGGDQFTASGDSRPAANLPHSAASATIQEPSPFVRKRLRKETTVPRYELGLAHWRMCQPELIVWHRCLLAKTFFHEQTWLLYGCSYDMLLRACFQNAALKQCRSIPCCSVISSAVFSCFVL